MIFPTKTAYEQLAPFFKEHIRMNEPLSLHNYFESGGQADTWVVVERRKEPHLLLEQLISYRAHHQQMVAQKYRTDLIFRDPAGVGSAAKLIMQVGLQGKTIGHARISETNANYIVNLGDATTTDAHALIAEGYQKVREHSQVRLHLNLEFR